MNTSHKSIVAGIVMAIGIGLLSLDCSNGSSNPSSPETEDPDASLSIGPTGGTLTYEGFSLTVPPGAFSATHEIGVIMDDSFDAVSDGAVTSGFHISGLPQDIAAPLHLRLQYAGEITGDPLISLSTSMTDPSTDEACWFHLMIIAQDSSGTLVADFPVIMGSGINKAAKISDKNTGSLTVQGQGDYKRKWGNNNLYTYPASFTGNIDDVIQILENNLQYIQNDLGFDFISKDVEGINLAPFVTFGFYHSVSTTHAGLVYLGGKLCPAVVMPEALLTPSANNYLIKLESGQWLLWLYMLENLAEIKANYLDVTPERNTWFPDAVRLWSQLIFSDGARDIPSGFPGFETAALYGLNSAFTAEGWTPLIQYLTQQSYYGIEGLQKTVQKIRETENTARSIVETVDDNTPATTWLPDFFQTYFSGDIFNVNGTTFLERVYEITTWNVDSKDDTLKVLSESYYDLSATLFLVDINYNDLSENAELLIDADGPPVAHDYGINVQAYAVHPDGTLEFLVAADANQANVAIPKLKENADGGVNQYLIAVVYSDHHDDYLGSTDIDLTLHINQRRQVDYNTCHLSTGFIFDIEKYTPGGNPEYRTYTNNNHSHGGTCPVTLDEAAYHGTSFTDYGNVTVSNELTVTLSEDLNSVLTLEWTYQEKEKDIHKTLDIHLIAEDIPLVEHIDEVNYAQYRVLGDAVLQAIKEFSYSASGDLGTETLVGALAVDATSVIRIDFGKE